MRPAPAALREQIIARSRAFDGKAGVAIVSLRDGWEIAWNANTLFPQQSCSKLWVSITALDAVDRGQVKLTDKVTLGRSDLTLFHQPIAEKILGGGHTTTLGALMFTAITESDNTANDKLMRSVGGPQAVRDVIARKGLGSIRFSALATSVACLCCFIQFLALRPLAALAQPFPVYALSAVIAIVCTVVPIFIGEGIPLLAPRHREVALGLLDVQQFPDDVVQLHYKVQRSRI